MLGTYFYMRARNAYRGSIRSRLLAREKKANINTRDDLVRIRRSRSLTSEGDYLFPGCRSTN